MNYAEWKTRTLEAVRGISDLEYQRRSWFGVGPEVSSPNEMLCQIFDDNLLPGFIEEHRARLTESQVNAAQRFLSAMTDFADSTPKNLDPTVVFNDVRWRRIRLLATELLESWADD